VLPGTGHRIKMVGVLLWSLTAEFHQVLRAHPGSLIVK
jgi:hypothetical protein